MLILAGSSLVVARMLTSVAASAPPDIVVVDATIPPDDPDGDESRADGFDIEWIHATLPRARVVRAFASVPAEALAAIGKRSTSESATLAVPLASDDAAAKALVESFMRDIGVEPFDLGALANVGLLEPGGALWGKALNPTEMLETVGWLSGDG